MAKTIAIKIDVTKIEKERLFKGQKGTYLDAVLFLEDEPDQYGQSGMIVQSVSKEERQAGVKGPILGNVKLIGQQAPSQPKQSESNFEEQDDDLPF